MQNKLILLLIFTFFAQGILKAKEMLIIAPYTGTITNKLDNSDYNLNLKDTAPMYGAYFQWIKSEKFQGNLFYYKSSNLNYSNLKGLHAIVDWYPKVTDKGKYVIGLGVEKINVDMNAESNLSGFTSFEMNNNILYYYVRAGQYRYFEAGKFKGSLLPYIGYSYEKVELDLEIDFTSPFVPYQDKNIIDKNRYPIAGLNLSTKFHHFAEIKLKYMSRFEKPHIAHSSSAIINVYFTRHFGLSYRYKYMEHGKSSDKYHLVGIVICFQ